ncbi:MAG: class I SAM-dependent methyltransferase [Cycloclasticus sp.]|nr:class I SAM-dependent methyltransferase [Cycloclasticus sp.]MBQ0790322.1 class I SAM-dependent methyltransferase [Cycloclasticus sp.]
MTPIIQAVLEEYHRRTAEENTLMDSLSSEQFDQRIDEFLLPIGPQSGQLMSLLIKGAQAKTVVEVGASYGYSTIWFAEAVSETGGKVISIELNEAKQAYAKKQLQKAGLLDYVEFKTGDALQVLSELTEPIDFMLLDLWKRFYIPCFDLAYPKLSDGATVLADNMRYPTAVREAADTYRAHVKSKPGIDSVLLNVGSGIELSRYKTG